MDSLLNRKLGQYDLLDIIGKGGQGVVYKAFDAEHGRDVAIKVFAAKEEVRRQKLARFKYEAHLAAALDHPNICTMYALFEDEDHTYMVMEYVEGKNLFELAFKRPLAIDSALRIIIQVADALAAAHDRGIIHRDIKPRNVMVTADGQARLLDFGLAKLLESDDDESGYSSDVMTKIDFFADIEDDIFLTQEGVALGTPASSPPEMALGLPSDHRGDIFSLGVILYLLLTGEYPFVARTKDEVRRKIINDDPIPVSKARNVGEPAPVTLIAVIERALQKDPDERFQSVDDMRDELQRILSNEVLDLDPAITSDPVECEPFKPKFATQKSTWPSQWPLLTFLVIFVLFFVMAILGSMYYF